jgi:hypothetical protein
MLSEQNIQTKSLLSYQNMLEKIGFKIQFQATAAGIKSLTTQREYRPDEITIINTYQFEERPPYQDNAILYAIESNNGERGTIISYGGSDQDIEVANFIKKVEGQKKIIR